MKYLMLLLLLIGTSSVFAGGANHHNAYNTPPTVTNEYVTNEYITNEYTTSTATSTAQTYTPEELDINSESFSSVMASMSAMANIPALPHIGEHGHTGIGVGVGAYNNKLAMSVGVLHQVDQVNLKATFAKAYSEEAIYGVGATFGFK